MPPTAERTIGTAIRGSRERLRTVADEKKGDSMGFDAYAIGFLFWRNRMNRCPGGGVVLQTKQFYKILAEHPHTMSKARRETFGWKSGGMPTHKNWDITYDTINQTWRVYTSSTAQGGGGSFKNRKPIGEIGCWESGMAERIHWWTERCLRSPLFRSLSLTIYLPTYLSSMYLAIYRSISLSLSPSFSSVYLSSCLSVYLSIYLSVYLSTCLSVVQCSGM